MENTHNLSLIYVDPIGKNSNGDFEYDFYFSETPDIVWAEDWAEQCPSACENVKPEGDFVTEIIRLKTSVVFFCIQKNSCFSLQDCIDGIVSIAFEDLSELDEYPEPYRIVFSFGESFDSVEEKLNGREIYFE